MLVRASCAGVSAGYGTVRLRRTAVLLWIALACAGHAMAGSFTAFGARVYTRTTGAPVKVRDRFAVLSPSTPYALHIRVNRVASAIVSINGVEVVRPSDFNATVTTIEKPVVLRASNEIAVELRGAPGGTLTIEIVGVDDDKPTITATTS